MDVLPRAGIGGGVVVGMNVFDDGARSVRRSGGGTSAGLAVRTGIVLVGTDQTVRQMSAMIGAMRERVVVAGAVITAQSTHGQSTNSIPGTGPVALPVPLLGTLDDLPLLVARFGLKMALVCVPLGGDGARVRDAVVRAGLPVREMACIEDVLSGTGILPVAATNVEEDRSASLNSDAERMGKMPMPQPRHTFAASPTIDLGRLIGRNPYEMDRDSVARAITGKRVLITGAGGSIGSELARVAATLEPAQLILMERAENALFEIDRRIATYFPGIKRRAVLHDVTDATGTMRLCSEIRPHAVFHAAAHKHVPLMEDHPAHAVTNNLFGTKSIADAAVASGAERFVLISSDKAVNPTSVMGATKRLAEMYVRGLGAQGSGPRAEGGTRLSMVRFGNVLGSNASVLTIWAQQIAEGGGGGPVTITDPRMTRYFMTIPEAATLVVQSTVLDPGGGRESGTGNRESGQTDGRVLPESRIPSPDSRVGVFVLDMGDPIRIVDLAARFIRAHGLEPRVRADTAGVLACEVAGQYPEPGAGVPTIDVVFSGIRPGEKIHEELAYAAEQLLPTTHPGVRSWAGPGFGADTAGRVGEMIAQMDAVRRATDRGAVIGAIRRHVPEMRTERRDDAAVGSGALGLSQTAHPNVG